MKPMGAWVRVRVKASAQDVLMDAAELVGERPNVLTVSSGFVSDTVMIDINVIGEAFTGTEHLIDHLKFVIERLELGTNLAEVTEDDNDEGDDNEFRDQQ